MFKSYFIYADFSSWYDSLYKFIHLTPHAEFKFFPISDKIELIVLVKQQIKSGLLGGKNFKSSPRLISEKDISERHISTLKFTIDIFENFPHLFNSNACTNCVDFLKFCLKLHIIFSVFN